MLRQLKSAPNLLTLPRLIFVPFVVVAIQQQKYAWALAIFVVAGITDLLDGLLARVLKQKTTLGQYLDPIADKLLLSTMFLMLSIAHIIRWPVTILVFSRDISILAASAVLFAIAGLRDFRPSIFGKANTLCQIAAVFFVMLLEIYPQRWVRITRITFLHATAWFTVISALHYLFLVQKRLREHTHALPPAQHSSP